MAFSLNMTIPTAVTISQFRSVMMGSGIFNPMLVLMSPVPATCKWKPSIVHTSVKSVGRKIRTSQFHV
jgi:hypothetical protein